MILKVITKTGMVVQEWVFGKFLVNSEYAKIFIKFALSKASDKYWYIIILAAVIIWQTISTDIYIFSPVPETPNFTTAIPLTTMKDF